MASKILAVGVGGVRQGSRFPEWGADPRPRRGGLDPVHPPLACLCCLTKGGYRSGLRGRACIRPGCPPKGVCGISVAVTGRTETCRGNAAAPCVHNNSTVSVQLFWAPSICSPSNLEIDRALRFGVLSSLPPHKAMGPLKARLRRQQAPSRVGVFLAWCR